LVDAYIRRATTLLDVARSSSQNLQLSYSEVDLSLQVRNSVAAITPAAHGARSSISLDIEENLVGVLDQTAVEQIIENLLSNAVRYGAGKPISVPPYGWFEINTVDPPDPSSFDAVKPDTWRDRCQD
jgi:signal transduction histidine kinase